MEEQEQNVFDQTRGLDVKISLNVSALLVIQPGVLTVPLNLSALFYERACQEQTSTSAAGQELFHGQLAPSPSGVAFSSWVPQLFSLGAARSRCGSLSESGLLQLQNPAAGSRT